MKVISAFPATHKNRPQTRVPRLFRPALALCLLLPGALQAQELIENGTFDDSEDPLKGWITDYEWTGNKHYVDNKGRVAADAGGGGRSKVVKITPAGDAGAKMECIPIKFEPGFRYSASLDVQGGPYRIYFAGYKWKPGVRPHDNPELGELRLIYKSKAVAGSSSSWEREKLELPGVKLSAQALAHLKHVRYVTLYVWMMKGGSVDNVSVRKVADPSIKF